MKKSRAARGFGAGPRRKQAKFSPVVWLAVAEFVTCLSSPWLRAFVGEKVLPTRLSQPALDVGERGLRQPLNPSEMEQIRGVSVDGVMHTLIETRWSRRQARRSGGVP